LKANIVHFKVHIKEERILNIIKVSLLK